MRRLVRQSGQLLVGHPQGDARQDQEAKQAIQAECNRDGVGGAFQSFGHGTAHLPG